MLPDPLLEPMNTADEDAVCDFIASKLDITLMYERKYIIMGCVCVCVCVYPWTLLNNSSTFFGFLSHRDILKTKDNPMELCAMCYVLLMTVERFCKYGQLASPQIF